MTLRTVFTANNPKYSNDYSPAAFCTDETFHWSDKCTWGEGFATKEEAVDDFWEHHDEDDFEDGYEPEILSIGSEWDGVKEDHSVSWLDPEDYATLCIEEAEDKLESPVFFEHCPRGFANEVGFIAVDEAEADEYRGEEGYEELTREELVDRMIYGAESHAEDGANGINTHCNPSSGSYGLEIVL